MSFWLYVMVMYCFLSVGDIGRQFSGDVLKHEYTPGVAMLFLCLTAPAVLGIWAFPVYAFFQMSWWQPIAGLILAAMLVAVGRILLPGSLWINFWAVGFSLAGTSLVLYQLLAL